MALQLIGGSEYRQTEAGHNDGVGVASLTVQRHFGMWLVAVLGLHDHRLCSKHMLFLKQCLVVFGLQLLDPGGRRSSPQFNLFRELVIRAYLAVRHSCPTQHPDTCPSLPSRFCQRRWMYVLTTSG